MQELFEVAEISNPNSADPGDEEDDGANPYRD